MIPPEYLEKLDMAEETSNNDLIFGLKLSNIPLINLRVEFNKNYTLFTKQEFREQLKAPAITPIQTDQMTWYGMPGDLITLLMQRAILGIEAYLPAAVSCECVYKGVLAEKIKLIGKPHELGGPTNVHNYYHRLPSILDSKHSLKNVNQDLWGKTVRFYGEIRNPIFHGNFLRSGVEEAFNAFKFLADIYDWIDSWHSPENFIKGAGHLSHIKSKIKPDN